MSVINKFFHLISNKETTVEEVEAFLKKHNIQEEIKKWINMTNEDGLLPIECVIKYGNSQVLDYCLTNLKANLTKNLSFSYGKYIRQHPLAMTLYNRDTRAYFLNPNNKIWEHLNDGTTALHIAACNGDLDAVRNILSQDINQLFAKTCGEYSVLDWTEMFNMQMTHGELIKFLVKDLVLKYSAKDEHGMLAKIYDLLASHYLNTNFNYEYLDRFLQRGLESCDLELKKHNRENNYAGISEFTTLKALININLAIYQLRKPNSSINLEIALSYIEQANTSFTKNVENLKPFANRLIKFYRIRIGNVEKEKNLLMRRCDVDAITEYKQLNDCQINLNNKIIKLFDDMQNLVSFTRLEYSIYQETKNQNEELTKDFARYTSFINNRQQQIIEEERQRLEQAQEEARQRQERLLFLKREHDLQRRSIEDPRRKEYYQDQIRRQDEHEIQFQMYQSFMQQNQQPMDKSYNLWIEYRKTMESNDLDLFKARSLLQQRISILENMQTANKEGFKAHRITDLLNDKIHETKDALLNINEMLGGVPEDNAISAIASLNKIIGDYSSDNQTKTIPDEKKELPQSLSLQATKVSNNNKNINFTNEIGLQESHFLTLFGSNLNNTNDEKSTNQNSNVNNINSVNNINNINYI